MLHVAGTNQKSRVVLSKEHMVFEPIGGYWMNHDESDALCELDILFFRQAFSISCHLFLLVLTVGF